MAVSVSLPSKQSLVIILMVSMISVGMNFSIAGVSAFLGSNTKGHAHNYNLHRRNGTARSTSQRFFHFDMDVESLAVVDTRMEGLGLKDLLGSDVAASVAATTTTAATTATSNAAAELESEVLLDASHLFLDFSVFVTESKPMLKLAQVVGRLLLLAQDYLPDKHVSPEELGIQVLMILVCLSKQHGESVSVSASASVSTANATTTTSTRRGSSGTTTTNNNNATATATETTVDEV